MTSKYDDDVKVEDVHLEEIDEFHKTRNGPQSGRVYMTEENSVQVRKKIDKVILPLLCWVYFLQILDKSVVGYGSIFGMQTDANLVGNQYSLIGSAGYWAQLGWQPFSAIVIVRVPTRILMPVIVMAWGISLCGMGAATNFTGLIVCRFLLGLFEASCLPLFALITTTWYRRSEQPLRIALWYGTNGIASMLGSLLAWALSFITGASLHVYQILFLLVGIITVLTGPIIYWKLDNSPAEARFLTAEERTWAIERLRDNQTGEVSTKMDWKQVWEAAWSPITWLFIPLVFVINTGASTSNTFGPLIISGFGFNPRQTILLNIPFGFCQFAVIMLAAWAATKFSKKSPILATLCLPCIAGCSILYALGRTSKDTGPLLVGYYLIAPLFAVNPLIVSWVGANTGGHSKKSALMACYQIGASIGNIVGPLLFTVDQKPGYKKGLRAVLGMFIAAMGIIALLVAAFMFLNKRKEAERVRNGKPAKLHDRSMEKTYKSATDDAAHADPEEAARISKLGQNGGLTDLANDEFVYTI